MSKIICGFAGIGKSTLARNYPNVVDLESTPFEKDWDRYVKVANHMMINGYTVLVSCHKELRDLLYKRKIPFVLALPHFSHKEEYLKRYSNRKNDNNFIKLIEGNWESFLEIYDFDEEVKIVDTYLEDCEWIF